MLLAPLLAPESAQAQACMCADTGLELPLSAVDAEAAELLHDALDAQASSSGELPVLQAAPDDSDDLPWCTSQNDAQCSKRPAGSTPSSVSVSVSPSLTLSSLLALPSPFSNACDYAEHSCGGPRDAVRLQLERPPQ